MSSEVGVRAAASACRRYCRPYSPRCCRQCCRRCCRRYRPLRQSWQSGRRCRFHHYRYFPPFPLWFRLCCRFHGSRSAAAGTAPKREQGCHQSGCCELLCTHDVSFVPSLNRLAAPRICLQRGVGSVYGATGVPVCALADGQPQPKQGAWLRKSGGRAFAATRAVPRACRRMRLRQVRRRYALRNVWRETGTHTGPQAGPQAGSRRGYIRPRARQAMFRGGGTCYVARNTAGPCRALMPMAPPALSPLPGNPCQTRHCRQS